jgi:hypothetical protein
MSALWQERKSSSPEFEGLSALNFCDLLARSPKNRLTRMSYWMWVALLRGRKLMRTTFMRLAFASAVSFVCYQNADAVPVDAAAMTRAAISASTVQEVQFYARPTRHGVIKCYRQFVVGRPVCRHFYRWR